MQKSPFVLALVTCVIVGLRMAHARTIPERPALSNVGRLC